VGQVLPAASEDCGNKLDDDCNGQVNDGCKCTSSVAVACYGGDPKTEGKGICHAGTQTCAADGSGYGACQGEQQPKAETCAGTEDEDCDGLDCVEWAYGYGDASGSQQVLAVALDPTDGSPIVAGVIRGSFPFGGTTLVGGGGGAVVVARMAADGSPAWAKSFGDNAAGTAVAADADGNVYVGGFTLTSMMVGTDLIPRGMFLLAFDKSGGQRWTRSLGNAPPGGALFSGGISSLGVLTTGDLLVAGSFAYPIDLGDGAMPPLGATPSQQTGLVATVRSADGTGSKDPVGSFWARAFPLNMAGAPRAVADSQGKVYMGTTFSGTTQIGALPLTSAAGKDIAVGVFDPMGNVLQGEAMGGVGDQVLDALAITAFGRVVIAGRMTETLTLAFSAGSLTATSTDGDGFVLACDDSQGTLSYAWGRTFGVSGEVLDLGLDVTGDVRLLGWFKGTLDLGAGPLSAGAGQMMLLAHLAGADGALRWNRGWPYPIDVPAVRIAVAPPGDSIVGGWLKGGPFDLGTGPLIAPGDIGEAWVGRFAP
jgi:hypothetical protein